MIVEEDSGGIAERSTKNGIAIKMMKDRHQWECEIRARQKFELDSCVVKLLGWHVPQGEETISGDALHPEPSDPRSKF